jgi:large subunit ribosomal protein L23
MQLYQVLRRPVLTEKSDALAAQGKYVFRVDKAANKLEIKAAVEHAFNVDVVNVNLIRVPARLGRFGKRRPPSRPAFKKAIVTLKQGQTIKFFEGV